MRNKVEEKIEDVLDWLEEAWDSIISSRRGRVVLVLTVLIYLAMLIIFGGLNALFIGTLGLFGAVWLLLVLVWFVGWVIYGND